MLLHDKMDKYYDELITKEIIDMLYVSQKQIP